MADIFKAGWLYKQSSFLKRWKKSWYSLSIDGYLRQFESPDKFIANKTLYIPNEVIAIKVGAEVNAKAPSGFSIDYLIKLITRDDSWILCAENIDDMLAWQISFEQVRVSNQQNRMRNNQQTQIPVYLQDVLVDTPSGHYPMYYRGNYRGNFPSRIVHTPQGPITIVYVDKPYNGRYYNGLGYGALAGTALATSLLFTPFWFPLFWC